MTLSLLTPYTPIPNEGTLARPSVWNSRFSRLHENMNTLNSDLSAAQSLVTLGAFGPITVSASTFSGAFVGLWSGNTLRAESGNTITSLSTVSISGGLTASGKIHVGENSNQGGESSIYGLSVTKAVENGAGAGGFAFAGELVATDSTDDTSGAQHVAGAQIAGIATSAGSYHELWGAIINSVVSVGNTSDLAIGTYTNAVQSRGTLLCGVGAEVQVLRFGGSMRTAIGLAVGYHSTHTQQGFNSVATTQYGILVGPISGGVSNYAISTSSGSVDLGDALSVLGSIRFRAGTSAATAVASGVLFTSVNAATVSTGTATLTGGSSGGTYVLKANTLAKNGDALRIVYNGAPSSAGSFSLALGSLTLFSSQGSVSNAGTFVSQAWVSRADATHVYWNTLATRFTGATVHEPNRSAGSVSLDLTADQNILFQGSASAGTMIAYLCQVHYEAI